MDNIYKKHDSCKQKKSKWQRSEWYGYNSKFRKKDSAFSKILAGIYKIFNLEKWYMVYKLVIKESIDSKIDAVLGNFDKYEEAKRALEEYLIFKTKGQELTSLNKFRDKLWIDVVTEVEDISKES